MSTKQPMSASLAHLPTSLLAYAPELRGRVFPEETGANCASCPLAGDPFLPEVRCCTYEPTVPNYSVGLALKRGPAPELRARLATGVGVDCRGVRPSAEWRTAYRRNRDTDFGRNPEWACPYWRRGTLSCSIWMDRPGACRTWHCRHVYGERGHHLWRATYRVLAALESAVSDTIAGQLTREEGESWEHYFLRCADAVERVELPIDCAEVERSELREVIAALNEPEGTIFGVDVREVVDHGDTVELQGYSPWITDRFPKAVFALLAAFDGERELREVLDIAQTTDPSVDPSWVERLRMIGVLRTSKAQGIQWGFEGEDLDPARLQDQLTGSSPAGDHPQNQPEPLSPEG